MPIIQEQKSAHFPRFFINYYPAVLREYKSGWVIEYYVQNPYPSSKSSKDEFIRKVQKVNHIVKRYRNKAEAKRHINKIITELNMKLASGWNPCVEKSSGKHFVPLVESLNLFLSLKMRELDDDSIRSYKSFIKILVLWIEKKYPNLYSGSFSPEIAEEFMLSLKLNPSISNRTYNNYLGFYRGAFGWLVKSKYMSGNPFTDIDKVAKKFTKKKRKYLNREQLRLLVEFLEKENPRYLCMCLLTYYCFLRPTDLVNLKKSSFDLKRNLVFISEDYTKNDHNSYRVIPRVLDKHIRNLNLDSVPPNDYIFSEYRTFLPGKKLLCSRKIAKYWATIIRSACNFGMEFQFYSLKDSGITYMMEDGVSVGYVQGQADHSSLEVTSKYNHTKTPEGFEQIRNLAKEI